MNQSFSTSLMEKPPVCASFPDSGRSDGKTGGNTPNYILYILLHKEAKVNIPDKISVTAAALRDGGKGGETA